jgi:hypothetical protein
VALKAFFHLQGHIHNKVQGNDMTISIFFYYDESKVMHLKNLNTFDKIGNGTIECLDKFLVDNLRDFCHQYE